MEYSRIASLLHVTEVDAIQTTFLFDFFENAVSIRHM